MKYEYREEWYRGVEGAPSVKRVKGARADVWDALRAFASVIMCAAASYAGAAIIGTGLASDTVGKAPEIPKGEASFVMSWSWDTEADAVETEGVTESYEEHIRKLAEAYIAEKSSGE